MMGNEFIVVEDGVIQCEHGGKVVLKSSVVNHVIGGKKPLHDIDLMNAPISGCPHDTSHGNQCTKVVAISSAVTESNVGGKGKNYLLRVDGCKTDKGAGLILVAPGQSNSKVPAPSSSSSGSPTTTGLENAKPDTRDNIKKEKYRIHPLRKSNKTLRALRGARDFSVVKNHHYGAVNNYTREKVITKTDAYLYVTHDGKTTEYKVVNKGTSINPSIQKVQFYDTRSNIIRKHIPFYKEEGTIEIVYANVKLSDADRAHFTPTVITIGDAKNAHVKHPKDYSKGIKHEEKAIKKVFITLDEAKKLNKAYVNIVLPIDDPIGEVEDLYEEMKSSFYRAYAYNRTFTDRVKERNAYAFSVAYFMDELALSKDEKDERKELKRKLTKAYYTLVDGVKEEFLPYIVDTCKNRGYTWSITNKNTSYIGHTPSVTNYKSTLVRLNGFIEHDVALSYLTEVKLCASSLLKSDNNRRTGNLYKKNDFEGGVTTYLKEKCRIDAKHGYYLCLGRGVADYDYENAQVKKRALTVNYDDHRQKSTEVMALTLFSLYFSGRHDDVVNAKGSKYKDAAEEFHYYLKRLQTRPEFDDDVQDDINDKFDNSGYANMFKNAKGKRNDSFIDDYDAIETTAKECAFSWKKNGQIKKFENLVPKDEKFDFYFDKTQSTPNDLVVTLAAKLKAPELKTLLGKYIVLKHTSAHRIDLLLNMAHMLTHSRTMFDTEVTNTSPFNAGSAVIQLLKAVSETLQNINASEHEKIYKTPIFGLYHKSLHGIILHALLKGYYNADGFATREKNANDFLSALAHETEKEYQLDLSNLNDGNIDKDLKVKKAHEKLFEQLKALDGITSQIHGAEDKQRAKDEELKRTDKQKKAKPGSKTTDDRKKWTKTIRNSRPYKVSISTMKGLSFFVTLFTTGDALKTYNKNDLKALLEITTGINSITKTVVETGTKILPKTQKAMLMVDFLLAEHSIPQKIIAKLAIPAVVVGAYYEVEALDNEDYDAMVMISTKAAITVALAFVSGFWIAAAGYIALEILWYIFSSYFIDSRVEVMIEKSLFYQDGRRPYILESLSTTNGRFYIRRGYKDALMSAKDITKIGGAKEVRDFVYKNYTDHKKELQAAAAYEFSEIYRALKNISIKVEKLPTHKYYNEYINNYQQTIDLNLNGYIRVNKEYYDEMKGVIYLIEDNNYSDLTLIDATVATDKGNDKLIDIFESFKKDISSDKLEEDSKKNYHILIDSGVDGATSIKYQLGIEYYFRTEAIGNQFVKKINYYLDELIPTPLSSQDIELLK